MQYLTSVVILTVLTLAGCGDNQDPTAVAVDASCPVQPDAGPPPEFIVEGTFEVVWECQRNCENPGVFWLRDHTELTLTRENPEDERILDIKLLNPETEEEVDSVVVFDLGMPIAASEPLEYPWSDDPSLSVDVTFLIADGCPAGWLRRGIPGQQPFWSFRAYECELSSQRGYYSP